MQRGRKCRRGDRGRRARARARACGVRPAFRPARVEPRAVPLWELRLHTAACTSQVSSRGGRPLGGLSYIYAWRVHRQPSNECTVFSVGHLVQPAGQRPERGVLCNNTKQGIAHRTALMFSYSRLWMCTRRSQGSRRVPERPRPSWPLSPSTSASTSIRKSPEQALRR